MIDKEKIWKSVKSGRLRKNDLSWLINIIIYSNHIYLKLFFVFIGKGSFSTEQTKL